MLAGSHIDQPTGQGSMALVRLTPDGQLDQSFGASGVSIVSGVSNSQINSIQEDSQGRILASGVATFANTCTA